MSVITRKHMQTTRDADADADADADKTVTATATVTDDTTCIARLPRHT